METAILKNKGSVVEKKAPLVIEKKEENDIKTKLDALLKEQEVFLAESLYSRGEKSGGLWWKNEGEEGLRGEKGLVSSLVYPERDSLDENKLMAKGDSSEESDQSLDFKGKNN